MTSENMNLKSVSANDVQIGGDHYKSEYQHWDFVEHLGLDYLQGCATKYISRWRKKNGVEDLKKSLHYIQKLIEVNNANDVYEKDSFDRFVNSNTLSIEDALCIKLVCIGDYPSLRLVGTLIEYLIEHHKK
jgi:hypothetical protein